MKLKGKVAVISGSAGAMGATEARLFAAEGASVVLGDITEEEYTAKADYDFVYVLEWLLIWLK